MGEIDIIITSQSTKVRDDALTGLDTIIMKSPTLPLGKREGYLKMSAGEITWFKRRGAFYTIEIIVESGCTCDKERCRDADEVDVLF